MSRPGGSVGSRLADVIGRAGREETPTIVTRRGTAEAVVVGIDAYRRLRQPAEPAERAEDAWLDQLADEVEAEGTDTSVSLEEMAALPRPGGADPWDVSRGSVPPPSGAC